MPVTDCFITQLLPTRAGMFSAATCTAVLTALPLLFCASHSERLPVSIPALHWTCGSIGTTTGGGVTIAINLAIAASSITKCSVIALKAAAVDASLLATRVVSCDSSRFVACRSDHRALYEGTVISPEIGGCRSYYAPLPESGYCLQGVLWHPWLFVLKVSVLLFNF